MTTKTRTKKASTKAKNAAAKATKKTEDGPSKRELQKARDAELTTEILERRENDEKWGEIASDLNITPGKAQFLVMLHEVAEGNVSAITFKNDDDLTAKVVKAREAEDEFSSWGWIAARTGVSEGKIKKLAEESGFEVKGSNIAVARAENAEDVKPKKDAKTARQSGRAKKSTGKPQSKVARAKARAKKADKDTASDPS